MGGRVSVHPFPARMAPELVTAQLKNLPRDLLLLDPMMGSGSFVLEAAREGYKCIGVDSDPLAVLISSAAASLCAADAAQAAGDAVAAGPRATISDLGVDDETRDFIDFWFDPIARDKLATLAVAIRDSDPVVRDVLWCAFSRLIITKTLGASRARDVSHSRPHVVRDEAAIDPIGRFSGSVAEVLRKRTGFNADQRANLTLLRGDARALPLADGRVGAIVTSPPYLTAIDYLRGHRLSLVWMGYSIAALRDLRGQNIGSERGAPRPDHLRQVFAATVQGEVSPRREAVINRYLGDLDELLRELARVTSSNGTVTFVVANSTHSGTAIKIDDALAELGPATGLTEQHRIQRLLPTKSRYLPPPTSGGGKLDSRMRCETILTFSRSA
jgi:hypothetical protein